MLTVEGKCYLTFHYLGSFWRAFNYDLCSQWKVSATSDCTFHDWGSLWRAFNIRSMLTVGGMCYQVALRLQPFFELFCLFQTYYGDGSTCGWYFCGKTQEDHISGGGKFYCPVTCATSGCTLLAFRWVWHGFRCQIHLKDPVSATSLHTFWVWLTHIFVLNQYPDRCKCYLLNCTFSCSSAVTDNFKINFKPVPVPANRNDYFSRCCCSDGMLFCDLFS